MKIQLPEFLYVYFHQCKNIVNDMEWITVYSDRENMRNNILNSINISCDKMVEIEVPQHVVKLVTEEFNSDNKEDVEKALNILYLCLYVLGGTS